MAWLHFQRKVIVILCCLLFGCAGHEGVYLLKARQAVAESQRKDQIGMPHRRTVAPPEISDWGWSERVVTEDDLDSQEMKDPALNAAVCHQILTRLNSKADSHIYDDIRKQRPLRVPNDLRACRNWTPLPRQVESLSHIPKSILVVKDIPSLGWYENGKLLGDSQVALGNQGEGTNSGVYKILEKAPDIYSLTCMNDLGEPHGCRGP